MIKTVSILLALCLAVFAQDYALNDIKTLNYALTLEHLEAAFYRTGLTNITAQQFTDAGYNASVYNYIGLIAGHEKNHVDFLTSTITTLGGTPVRECSYNFTAAFVSATTFIQYASVFENTGVRAYDGAIDRITNLAYQTAAATIVTIEARHAAYLNEIAGAIPFPTPFDNATTPEDIFNEVKGFIITCDATTQNISILPNKTNVFPAAVPTNQSAADLNDIAVLKYALTLENLENAFYAQGLANFTADDFTAAGINASVRTYIELIAGHESTHVSFISGVIGSNNIAPCTYNFTNYYTNVTGFLAVAQALENTGTYAYNGAVNAISNLGYRVAAATITTVEARHAAYLNELNRVSPFPNAANFPSVDMALNRSSILAIAGQFIVQCPYNVATETAWVPAAFSPATTPAVTGAATGAASTSASSTNVVATSTTGQNDNSSSDAGKIVASIAAVAAIAMML